MNSSERGQRRRSIATIELEVACSALFPNVRFGSKAVIRNKWQGLCRLILAAAEIAANRLKRLKRLN